MNVNRFWCRTCFNEWRGGNDIECTCSMGMMNWICINFEEQTFCEFTEQSILSNDSSVFTTFDRITPGWMNIGCLS